MNIPSIWGRREMKWSLNLWHEDKPVRMNIGWRRKTGKGREIEENEKEVKKKMMEKVVGKLGV